MKTKHHIFSLFLFVIVCNTTAQEFLNSNARIFRETGESISHSEDEKSVIKLNPQTNQFRVDFCVWLNKTSSADQQLTLEFTGPFPINDLDFYDLEGEGRKTYAIIGELTINNITRTYTQLHFTLHRSNLPNNYSPNVISYPYNIAFLFEINPAEFCLENILENCPRTLFVEVKDGIINRFTNGYGKPKCETRY